MGEFDTVKSVHNSVPFVFDMTDHRRTRHAFVEPSEHGICVFAVNGQDHAHAHVKRAIHLSGFHATDTLQPFKFRKDRQRRVNVPSKRWMKAQEVRQTTAGDVADTVHIVDAERGSASCCVEQVNHRVAVNPCRVEHDFTKGCISLSPANQVAIGMLRLKRCCIGVVEPSVFNDLPYE